MMGIQAASSLTTTTARHATTMDKDDNGDGVMGNDGSMGDNSLRRHDVDDDQRQRWQQLAPGSGL